MAMYIHLKKLTKKSLFTFLGFIIFFLLSPFQLLQAQQKLLTGKVFDLQTKKPLSGVSIKLKGQSSETITDAKGSFSIGIKEQQATLMFSHVGYGNSTYEVSVSQPSLTVFLKRNQIALDEVKVYASKRVNTEAAMLEERRKAGIIQDGISAQQIERTASITTTQALQRVVGVTVTDDKYVAIRGLGDRSVIGQLNGVRLASANPDRSAVPLDLIPASLLDNITVYKTYTPDKPADAASGIVELKTKSVPDSLVFQITAQTGLNSAIGIGGSYNSFWNSDMGFWGNKINKKNLRQDFLDLANQYPNGLGSIQKLIANTNFSGETKLEVDRINGIMQQFDQKLTTDYKKASPNKLFSATFGNGYNVFDHHRLGIILGANYYRRQTDIYDGIINQYSVYQGVVTGNPDIYSARNIPNYITPNNLYLGRYQSYKENTGNETLNYGVLGGAAYRFSPRHELSFVYLGSWGGENNATNMHGSYDYTGLPGDAKSYIYSLKQTYRNLHTYQFQGEHKFKDNEFSPQLSYSGSISTSYHNDPDYRFVSLTDYKPWAGGFYNRPIITDESGPGQFWQPTYSDHLYALVSGYVNGYGPYGIIQADPNGRRWRRLNEKNYNYKADLTIPFQFIEGRQELKVGGNYLFRDRKFSENHLLLPGSNFTDMKAVPIYDVDGNLDRLISNEIIGVHPIDPIRGEGMRPVGGFLYNSQKSPNNYTGYYESRALYAMLNLHFNNKWHITGGLRLETTDLASKVDTSNVYLDPSLTRPSADGNQIPLVLIEPNSHYKTGYLPFYSLNVTYALQERMNLRVAYNTTLARPELREITNVYDYDAFQLGLVVGNPNLKNQHTQNLDFRWEWFTGPGEVVAVSGFGKKIENQLVKVFSLKTDGLAAVYPEFPTIQFQNEQNTGYVWGVELEAVKDMGKVYDPLRYFFIGVNVMLAQSDIRKSDLRYEANQTLDRHTPKNSPLFEQAPYSINGWLNFTKPDWGTDLTATFNMVGERLVQINLLGEPDLYTRPAPVLDFVFSQKLSQRLLFKGYAKNIINPSIKTVYANPGTGGKWYRNEYINRSYKRGCEIMMGFTYNIF